MRTTDTRRPRKPLRGKGLMPPMVRVGWGMTDRQVNQTVETARERATTMLIAAGLADYFIDEVAFLLPPVNGGNGATWLARMMGRVGRAGFTYFNHVDKDVVKCNPLPSQYEVIYDFFTTGVEGVRLELLTILEGHSPLHNMFEVSDRDTDASVVHASFKVPDEDVYRMTLAHLQGEGWMCGQYCESSYGLFSYWRHPSDVESVLWLKPRVNLRDAAKPVLFSPEDQEDALDMDKYDDDELDELLDEETEDDDED